MKTFLTGAVAAIGLVLVIGSVGLALLGTPADDRVVDAAEPSPPTAIVREINEPVPVAEQAPAEPPAPVAPVVADIPPLTLDTLRVRRADVLERRQVAAEAAVAAEIAMHQSHANNVLLPERDQDFTEDRRAIAAALRESCANADPDACAGLARMYEDGDGVWSDAPLAVSLSFLACQAGSDQGCVQFSRSPVIETYGYAGSFPHVAHFEKRCAEDHAESCAAMALRHRFGIENVLKDEDLAETLYRKACDLGDAGSCDQIGETAAAVAIFQASCAQDDAAACAGLSRKLSQNGEDAQSLEAALKACDLGSGQMCRDIAERYVEGNGVAQDAARALDYRLRACDLGQRSGCLAAAGQYETGDGTPVDLQRAEAMFGQFCTVSDDGEGCAQQRRIHMASVDVLSDEADAPLADNPDAAGKRQACTDGDAAACTDLGKMHRASFAETSAHVAAGLFDHACTLGDADGCANHLRGLRGEEARALATQLCEAGVEAGCLWIASFDQTLDGAERFALLEDGCAAGQLALCDRLGTILLSGGRYFGHDVPIDVDRALVLATQACDGGHGGGCATLGRSKDPNINNDQWDNVPKDAAAALALYERGCALDDSWACQMLGYTQSESATTSAERDVVYQTYRKSCVLSDDCEEMQRAAIMRDRAELKAEHGMLGAALLERYDDFVAPYHGRVRRARRGCAAGQGHDCILLGDYYYRDYASGSSWGLLHNASDRELARALYLQACELGDPMGCWTYADSHTGIGDETDYDTALIYFTKGCDADHGLSCQSAGYIHELDKDDEATAGLFYSKGCDLGDVYACDSLSGINDIPDDALIAEYRLRACLNADGLACEFLAGDYRAGRYGLPKDIEIARELLRYGCEDGDEDSCSFLDRIANE